MVLWNIPIGGDRMQITALDHEWQKRIEEARASGLTAHAWCRENNIPISTFYYHLRRIRRMSQYEQDDFDEKTSIPVQEQAVVCVQTMDPERLTMTDERIARIRNGSVYADIFSQAKEDQIRSIIDALTTC